MTIFFRILLEIILNFFGFLKGKSLSHTAKKRIAFQAYSSHLAQFYITIIEQLLKKQNQFEIYFIILQHPHCSIQSTLQLKQFANQVLNIPLENIKYYWQVLWERFDMVVYTDIYAKFQLHKTINCLLFHGPGLTYRNVQKSYWRKNVALFDLVLLNGGYDYELLRSYFQDKQTLKKLITTGFPFLDRLSSLNVSKEFYCQRLSLNENKKNILVAPSWRGLNHYQTACINWMEDVLTTLSELDVNTIIKLHACSFHREMSQSFDWDKALIKLQKRFSFQIDKDIDDIPALKFSDCLITDISSRAFNFMLLDKPIILYLPIEIEEDCWSKMRMEPMRHGSYIATKPQEILECFTQFNHNDMMKKEREEIAKLCFSHRGNATNEVIKIIETVVYGVNRNGL